jgi:hypothetical protein
MSFGAYPDRNQLREKGCEQLSKAQWGRMDRFDLSAHALT